MPNLQHSAYINQAKTYFKDKLHKVWLYPCERIYTKEGFCYLALDKDKRRAIDCAIHYSREFVVTEEIGRLHTTSIDLSTNEAIDIQNAVLVYEKMDLQSILSEGKTQSEPKDMYIFLKSFEGFNETFSFYSYNGEALTCDKESVLHKIEGVYGWSVFDKIQSIKDFTIFPFFANIETSTNNKAIIAKVTNQQAIGAYDKKDGVLMVDSVKFTMLHYSRDECQKFINHLQDSCVNGLLDFGIISDIQVRELDDLQETSALRGLANSIEVDLSYTLKPISEIKEFAIKKMYFEIKKAI